MEIRNLSVDTFWKGESRVQGELEDGEKWYKTRIYVRESRIFDYSCTCPEGQSYRGPCAHARALLEAFRDREKGTGRLPVSTSPAVRDMIRAYTNRDVARIVREDEEGVARLVPRLLLRREGLALEARVSRAASGAREYLVKDLTAFSRSVRDGLRVEYGKGLAFEHSLFAFEKESRPFAAFLLDEAGAYARHYEDFGVGRASARRYEDSGVGRTSVRHYEDSGVGWSSARRYEDFGGHRALLPPALRVLPLRGAALDRFFRLVEGRELAAEDERGTEKTVRVLRGNPDFPVKIRALEPEGIEAAVSPQLRIFRGERGFYVSDGQRIFLCDGGYEADLGIFLERITQPPSGGGENRQRGVVTVGRRDIPLFYERVLRRLEARGLLQVEGIDWDAWKPPGLRAQFDFDSGGPGEIRMTPTLFYGDFSFHPLRDEGVPREICRDVPGEFRVSRLITRYFEYREDGTDVLVIRDDEDALYRLVREGLEEFRALGEVRLSEQARTLRVLPPPSVSLGVTLEDGWLDLRIEAGELRRAELFGILAQYRQKKKYYRLKSGEFLELTDEGLLTVSRLAEGLELGKKELSQGEIRLPAFRAFYLDSLAREDGRLHFSRDPRFGAMIRDLGAVGQVSFRVPASLERTLREYQKAGFSWLRTLDHYGFGGILADDMGLGKTIQIIALILSVCQEREENWQSECPKGEDRDPEGGESGRSECLEGGEHRQSECLEGGESRQSECSEGGESGQSGGGRSGRPLSLIVCPASLIYNWGHEFSVFAPSLRVLLAMGKAAERREVLSRAGEWDVIVTSYDLLKRDLAFYEKLEFRFAVIDEAQFIKNAATQSARAVKRIRARTRLALTGTPVENRLGELWSIFDYLMPGFLFSYRKFRTSYEAPIVREGDGEALARLQRMIRPFILRRLKADVLRELPDKLEKIVYSAAEGRQCSLYEAEALLLKEKISRGDDSGSGRLEILSGLTRLRQICCDPSLCYENYGGGSAKLETCVSLLKTAAEAGHKILLFSQFASMLEILRKRLEKEGLSCHLLTGATSREERNRLVNAFDRDEVPIFLISLKAGGTGLNLTAADVVVHYDPWWNVAAQNQATDRAHRIGQTRTVTVCRLIMKDTIEENILKLQERKRSLADQVVTEGMVSLGSLSREELLELCGGEAKD